MLYSEKGLSWPWSYGSWIYNYLCNRFDYRSGWGVLDTTLCDKVCQWLAVGWRFFPGNPVSATNKTDSHDDITEILLKVTLNTIKPTILLDSLKYLTKITPINSIQVYYFLFVLWVGFLRAISKRRWNLRYKMQ